MPVDMCLAGTNNYFDYRSRFIARPKGAHWMNVLNKIKQWESCILGDVKDPKDTISIGAIQIRGGKHQTRSKAIEWARNHVEQHNRTVHKVY